MWEDYLNRANLKYCEKDINCVKNKFGAFNDHLKLIEFTIWINELGSDCVIFGC